MSHPLHFREQRRSRHLRCYEMIAIVLNSWRGEVLYLMGFWIGRVMFYSTLYIERVGLLWSVRAVREENG